MASGGRNLAVASTVVLSATGCATKPGPTSAPSEHDRPASNLKVQSINQTLSPPVQVLPVKQGPAPLVYIVESTTRVRVVESETGVILCDVGAKPRQIVSVSERNGILVGDVVVRPGPLPANRHFAIYLGSDELNTYSSERITVQEKP